MASATVPPPAPPASGRGGFAEQLRARISFEGGITVERYMALCNAHYYATRDPLGAAGDFTTAPEISQMFGELVGAALADCWLRAGAPGDAVFVELGPGLGTLAADALRVLRGAGFAGQVHLVETSPRLRAEQAERVPDAVWHDAVESLPRVPLLLVANEFLDALPVRQWVGAEERMIVLEGERLAFSAEGEVREDSPARDAVVAEIAALLVAHGGAALMIDYGHAASAPGDTLQAVRRHQFADVLDAPGEQDLTAHVDFAAVACAAIGAGAAVTALSTQGAWLGRLGIAARAAALAAANPERADEIAAARARLCDDDAMGELFKVVAIQAPGWPAPAGLAA
ncbi:SAM-dependent methyltransferase [Sphingomonas sp.]|uniref:class I SAM-dependent methyltransferase n=1 Tax=Sphingomonas sp. TaxID=28214 RepID=UPI00286E8EDD|nr:SAM-dependent methyltransferase [Sphingomonas sp.]